MPPTLLLTHGRFYTPSASSRDQHPHLAGCAMLIREGRIAAIGSTADIARLGGDVGGSIKTVDLAGRTVVPGLVDSHCHLDGIGMAMRLIDLSGTRSKAECIQRVAERVARAEPGEYLMGRGFNVNDWNPPAFPTAADLDAVAPDHPVALAQFDGHGAWINTCTMRDSGINAQSPDVDGGSILRDAAGQPTGMLFENALRLIQWPVATDDDYRACLADGIRHMQACGYTAVHVMAAGSHQPVSRLVDMMHEDYGSGPCPLRVRGYVLDEQFEQAVAARRRWADDPRFQVTGIKTFADGSLNSHTAWMLEPYEGEPDNTGVPTLTHEQLANLVRRCTAANLPLATHAIGDRAIREVLNALEAHSRRDLPHRIEHVQHLDPDDLPRFAALNVTVSMQTCHLMPDWKTADRILGRRSRWTYAARSLLESGANLALGSDAPVVRADWRDSLLAAIRRTDGDGKPERGWHPQEALTVGQWLWAHTVGPARAVGEADQRGRLEVGMDADLTILGRDIFAKDFDPTPQNVLSIPIDATVVAGMFTHRTL